MNLFEKLYTVLIFLAVLVGIGIGQITGVEKAAETLIVPFLIAMLYITFLQIPIEQFKYAFRNFRFTITSVIINFIWTPIFAWFIALIFLGDHHALYIGFIMLMVTPCTDWYLIFTGIAKGNVALSTAILPLNLILQIILLPVYLLIFGNTTGMIELSFLVESVLLVLFIPLLLAFITNHLLKNREPLKAQFMSKVGMLPMIFLSLAIASMFASQGQLLLANLELLWKVTVPILLFFGVNFIVSQRVSNLLKFSVPVRTSLSLTTLARNSPVALAIAMTAFPNEPLIALTLVIGPLLELPILAVITQVIIYKNGLKA